MKVPALFFLALAATPFDGFLVHAASDSSYTGTSNPAEVSPKKADGHSTHKSSAKKKKKHASITPAISSPSTNTMATPVVPTDPTPVPVVSTNTVTTPATSTDENSSSPAPITKEVPNMTPAPPLVAAGHVGTLKVGDLREFEAQPLVVQKLISGGLELTTLNLPYRYGSSDPKDGGMDCSGTVYYLLREAGLKDVPRDASEMYVWAWKAGLFQAVVSTSPDTFELDRLKPGDLLFWTGTYRVERDPPVTHVMIYLGIDRHTGKRVMMGASEGRRFEGVSRYGVSVFDFTMPGARAGSDMAGAATSELQARFIGYAAPPGFEEMEGAEKPGP